jgi:predicted metalloprotease
VPTAPATPSSSPPPGPNQTLKGNAVYQIDFKRRSVSCRLKVRSPKPALRNKALAPYLRQVVRCLVKTFGKPLAGQGFELATPKVKSYGASVKTPCGTFKQKGAPAYYCSTTRTIYWPVTGDDGNEAYTFARLGYVGLAAHEFGHHLQASSGMLGDYASQYYSASKKQQYELSRRLELQAQCFEGVFLAADARSVKLTRNDRYQLRVWHGYTGDEDPPRGRKPDHGTSTAQVRWLERGLNSGDLARCNTWTAKAKTVR